MVSAQELTEGTPENAQKLVIIRQIFVEGTRLPALSVIGLAQIKHGDRINFDKLTSALNKVTATGLIRHIDFVYDALGDGSGEANLHLKCTDFEPSAKASIEIPKVKEDDVWTWLNQADPLFTRQMPPSEAAIQFYSQWITKYMESHGAPDFGEKFSITAKIARKTNTETLVFKPVKRKRQK